MRSTFAGLNTMVGGINANRLSLDTVGHNISNASTTGYSRQSVNLAATRSQEISSIYGYAQVGTGVDSLSITRARNIYADKQYWKENADQGYYDTLQTNYDKVETIFNDSSDNGIQSAMEAFYQAWSDLSTNASDSSTRITTVEQGEVFADRVNTAATQLQSQISANYEDLELNVSNVNSITDQIVGLNKNIASIEATGSSANDLRDQRDNLVDELSGYVDVSVTEDSNGMYTVVSNGATLVGGVNKLTLEMSEPINNAKYGVTDYTIKIAETGTDFQTTSGKLKAEQDTIAEDKGYIDSMANIAAFMLTDFNDQHKAGAGIDDDATTNLNFYGDSDVAYSWDKDTQTVKVKASTTVMGYDADNNHTATVTTGADKESLQGIGIIKALKVNSKITAQDGENLVAARALTKKVTKTEGSTTTYTVTDLNGTKDGSNAVLLSALFNSKQENVTNTTGDRSIGAVSLNDYYNNVMTALGTDSNACDSKVASQEKIMLQVDNWRSSTSGVNWNEELTNMIKFQQGFSACSRCLTTMDEMLDKLVNSTGTVGR